MAVFPEDMNRIDPKVPEEALRIIENYIHYLTERVEFSYSQMTKNITAAGVSNVEVYIQLTALQHSLSALTSDVNGLLGRMNSAESSITALQTAVGDSSVPTSLTGRMDSAEGEITSIWQYITNTIDVALSSLDSRVSALEGH